MRLDPLQEYARGVEWQGWGTVLLAAAALALVVWLLVLLTNPAEAASTWPFALFVLAFGALGFGFRRRGRREERHAKRANDPHVP